MKNKNFHRLDNERLQSMTTEELYALLKKHKSEIANLKKTPFRKKMLETECCYIQRELEFRLRWSRHDNEFSGYARIGG
jgi:hypothetical protein